MRGFLLGFWLAAAGTSAFAQRSDTIVRMAGAPRHPGVATMVREFSIGTVDGDDAYQFHQILNILPAKDGTLWVLEGQFSYCTGRSCPTRGNEMLRQYDSTGQFLRRVGRSGSGPGEWRVPVSMAELPDGRVLLVDSGLQDRLTLFNANGTFDTTWSIRAPFQSANTDQNGVSWLFPTVFPVRGTAGAPAYRGNPFIRVRFRSDGSLIDTIAEPLVAVLEASTGVKRITTPTSLGNLQVPYSPRVFVTFSPSGYFATGRTDRYVIDLRIPRAATPGAIWREGDPIVSIRRNVARVEVSESEWREQRSHFEALIKSGGHTLEGRMPNVPQVKPPIQAPVFGADGRIWVRAAVPSERYNPTNTSTRTGTAAPVLRWREPIMFDVFEPNGAYIGRVEVPIPEHPYLGRPQHLVWTRMRMRGDHVWFIMRDEDDVESIARYRVVWR